MNCEQARQAIGAEPAGSTRELEAHVAGCDDCRGFRDEMRRMEGDVTRAFAWPASAAPTGALPADAPVTRDGDAQAPAARAPGEHASRHGAPQPAARRWAFAAGVLLVGVLGASFLALQPADALASDVVAHLGEEPQAWASRQPVPPAVLDQVLRRSGVRLDRVAAGDVVYANSCFLRGRQVPHLVVATPDGPVTVLVLRGEKMARRAPFDEGGYRGVLMRAPEGGGGIAVLTRGGATSAGADAKLDVEAVAAKVLAAVEWQGEATVAN